MHVSGAALAVTGAAVALSGSPRGAGPRLGVVSCGAGEHARSERWAGLDPGAPAALPVCPRQSGAPAGAFPPDGPTPSAQRDRGRGAAASGPPPGPRGLPTRPVCGPCPLPCHPVKGNREPVVSSGLEVGPRGRAFILPSVDAAQTPHSGLHASSSEREPVPTATGSGSLPGRRAPHPGVLLARQQLPPGHVEGARTGIQPVRPHLPG